MRIRTLDCCFSLLAIAWANDVSAQATPHRLRPETVHWDTIGADGRFEGGRVELLVPDRNDILGRLPASVETLTGTDSLLPGPAHRVDLVFVGDGYQAAELGAYATHVNDIVSGFFSREPYMEYQNYFAIHRVDVASVDSGVDNDPTQGIERDTALDMRFWCYDIERFLCVDLAQAVMYANNAPAADLITAIANSTKYGGLGYLTNNLATSSGNHNLAAEIVMHEFGHALGNLADEYDYGSTAPTYTGGEPNLPNISTLGAALMKAAGTKWADWLGVDDPSFDGLVSTFEGAGSFAFGLNRPTSNSIMRSVGRPFNLPCAEAIILEIYALVRPIDASSDPLVSYLGTETLFVTPMQPRTHALAIQWSLNGHPIAGATGPTLDLTSLNLGGCAATIRVEVRDETAWVRNEAARTARMTQTRTFHVTETASSMSSYCAAGPNSVGPGALIGAQGSASVTANDLLLLTSGCPPGELGAYAFGSMSTQQVFGNGFRCIAANIVRLPRITTNEFGEALFVVDHASLPGGAVIAPGTTRRFQLWYRDPGAGGAEFNASDGLSVRFCP